MVNFSFSYNSVMEIEEVIGGNVKRIRESIKMTQKILAAGCGVTKHHIEDVEAGRRKPSLDLLMRMAGVLKVDSSLLLEQGERTEVARPLPFKTVLGMYSNIPEDIVKDLAGFGTGSEIWKSIREAIEMERVLDEEESDNGNGNGKSS